MLSLGTRVYGLDDSNSVSFGGRYRWILRNEGLFIYKDGWRYAGSTPEDNKNYLRSIGCDV